MKILSIIFTLIIILSSKSFGEIKNNLSSNTKEIEFTSDTIKVDELNKIVTALGNVVIINELVLKNFSLNEEISQMQSRNIQCMEF